jgi:hypothetical protein
MALPLIAAAAGGVAVVGVGIAAMYKIETADVDFGEDLNKSLVRIGYVTEGIVKGSIVAIPSSLLVLILFDFMMDKTKKVLD